MQYLWQAHAVNPMSLLCELHGLCRNLQLKKSQHFHVVWSFSQGSWEITHQTMRRSAATSDGTPKWTALQAVHLKGLLLPANPRGHRSLQPPPRDCAAGDWRSACWPLFSYTLSSSFQPPIILRCWTWLPFSCQRRVRRTRSEPQLLESKPELLRNGVTRAGLRLAGTHLAKRAGDVTAICCQRTVRHRTWEGFWTGARVLGLNIDPTKMFSDPPLKELTSCHLKPAHCFYPIQLFSRIFPLSPSYPSYLSFLYPFLHF